MKNFFLGYHLHKRKDHFNDLIINWLEKEEIKLYHKFVSKSKIKLDPIKKKKLDYPAAIYPFKNVPIEWWYFTGHLKSKNQRYGYEFCLFKVHPLSLRVGFLPFYFFRKKPFLVFHFALTDKNKKELKTFYDSGIIHNQEIDYNNLNLKLNNTSLRLNKESSKSNHNFIITTNNKVANLKLNLKPLKKLVKHFDEGYSVMYSPPEHRTYYLTFPRLKTTGEIEIGSKKYHLSGLSWFDHQKLNTPRKSNLKGWDWYSIILNDNTEIMFFMLRDKKGLTDKFMGGSYINKNSKTINLKPNEVKIKALSSWESPRTKINYPSGWNLKIAKLKINLTVSPLVKNQEIIKHFWNPITYWEGACSVTGKKSNQKIQGQAYVELVGYDKRFLTRLSQIFYG